MNIFIIVIIGITETGIAVIRKTNYPVEQAKEDYTRISDELRSLQTALDLVNTTVQMEFELPD